jgi:hypothetical protein
MPIVFRTDADTQHAQPTPHPDNHKEPSRDDSTTQKQGRFKFGGPRLYYSLAVKRAQKSSNSGYNSNSNSNENINCAVLQAHVSICPSRSYANPYRRL